MADLVATGHDAIPHAGAIQPRAAADQPDPHAGPLSPAPLGPADAEDMLDLVRHTEPGPFGARTVELGAFVGVRDNGRLVAV